ncbi:hypothetical protein COHA_003630 [Chlorella ohadii]|uniref:AB hydrolase-1 domain-containing protein n=1 Tax=Chlorella ohadii TaxID=2649997 RepID=A0AAD5DYF4_9CHLO|nr:hypothetical protein COHA_003630 [Chlorella ohadii]
MNDWGPTLLRRLAEKQDVIIFDNVAQGLSKEIEPTEGPITPAILEEATLDFLDALNLTRPHVAGWSLGACAALKLAALHPERVSKVVSWGGTSPDGRAVTGSLPTMKRLFNPNNTDEDYAPLNWDLSSPSGLKGACFWMSDKRRMPPNDARPEVNERYSQGAQEEVRLGLVHRLTGSGNNTTNHCFGCPTPAIQMTGTEDIVVPAKAATKLAGQIPGAWLAQFPGTGHGFIWERMDEVLAVMEAFLQAGSAEGQAAGGAEGHAAGSAEGHAAGSSGGGEAGQGGSADGEL